MRKNQYLEICKWQKETFGEANSLSKIAHLKQEVIELGNELTINPIHNKKERRLEFADCFILLFGAADCDGMTYEDICNAIDEKTAINKKRKWGKPDADGVVNHIK